MISDILGFSIIASPGGKSEKLSIGSVAASSNVIDSPAATIYSTVDCYYRSGRNPVAVSGGTDDFIPAGNKLRITGIGLKHKLSFKTVSSSGTVYITSGG